MANVSFHVGTSAPGASGLTTGGLYFNTSGGGIYYASSTTATSQVASKVSFSRNLTSGTKVGTITINGTGTDLYCQTNTDEKCAYTSSSANAEYPLLFKSSTSSTTTAGKPYFDTGITVNPATNKITAALFKGDIMGTMITVRSGSTIISPGFYFAFKGVSNTYFSTAFVYTGATSLDVYGACTSSSDEGSSYFCSVAASTGVVTKNSYHTITLYRVGLL